jgi:uncharacterized RDD family membrane protein YckC
MAQWWQRLLALLVDGLILLVPTLFIVAFATGGSTPVAVNSGRTVPDSVWSALGVAFVITVGYFAFLDGGKSGQTVGKRALHIAVRNADNGGPIGAGRALARRVFFFATYLGLGILFVINGLSPLWDRHRQAWHDKVARSCVVSVP